MFITNMYRRQKNLLDINDNKNVKLSRIPKIYLLLTLVINNSIFSDILITSIFFYKINS